MKPKTLLVLLAVLVILVGTGTFLMRSRTVHPPSEAMGAPLLEGLPVNDIASIVIRTPTDTVSLKKGTGFWAVEERFGYRADFSKISDLVRALKDAKKGRQFDASEEVMGRLALKPPDDAAAKPEEKGCRIQMADAKKKPIVDIIVGNTWMRDPQKGPSEGQYVMPAGGPRVCLIDKVLSSYEIGPAKWLEKSPIRVDAAQVEEIACSAPDGTDVRYTLKRPAKGKDLEWTGAPIRRKFNEPVINRLAAALSSLQIEDVTPADSALFSQEASGRLDYTLFDGRVYRVVLGKACSESTPCRIRLEAAFSPPKPKNQEPGPDAQADQKASDIEEKDGEAQTSAIADEAGKEDSRLKPWVFTIPEWQYQALVSVSEQLFETKDEKEAATGGPIK